MEAKELGKNYLKNPKFQPDKTKTLERYEERVFICSQSSKILLSDILIVPILPAFRLQCSYIRT